MYLYPYTCIYMDLWGYDHFVDVTRESDIQRGGFTDALPDDCPGERSAGTLL